MQTTTRHNGGSNWLCADGHVKWLTPERVSFGYRAASGTADYPSSTTGYEHFYGGTGTYHAEGTEYAGVGKHDITMSFM